MTRVLHSLASKTASPSAVVLALVGLALPAGVAGQAPIDLPRLEGTVVIDGMVNESAWDEVAPLEITQKVPVAGAPPSQPTEIRIAYDETYIYLSGRLYDDEPHRIVANTKKRDDFTENTEWVGLLIDTYDDRENALGFWVTPTGSRLDMAIANDAGGPQGISTDWNAHWDAVATRDERGWFAEMRIPFASLPFDAPEGRTVMGITAWRYVARNDETAIYPARGLESGSSFRPSLTQRFAMEGIQPTRSVAITPYTLAGRSVVHAATTGDGLDGVSTDYQREVGLDARLGLGGNVTLDLTLNTDFAQVEVDDQQVNLTRLNLFFPEKRLFFQERASLFDFNFGPTDRLFYSRRIGIVSGRQVSIHGGVRSVAKFGAWESGLLTMQTGSQDDQPSENFSVFRLKRRVLNENSTVGLIFTNRTDFSGVYNSVYGLDSTLRLFSENFLSLRWAQSFDDRSSGEVGSLDSARLFVELANRSARGFTYGASYGRAGAAYDPAVGFQSRQDFSNFDYTLGYNAFPSAASRFVQYGPYANGGLVWANERGALESRNLQFGVTTFTKSGWTSDLHVRSDLEVLEQPLSLAGGIEFAPGRYPFQSIGGSLSTPSNYRIAGFASFSSGEFFGGQKHTIGVSPTVTITPDLALTGAYQFNRIRPVTDARPVNVQLTTARLDYFFSTRLSASALVQHNNVSRLFLGSFRVRYNPKEGNDLYLVFNGDANQNRNRSQPALPLSNRNTLQLKYSYTFRP